MSLSGDNQQNDLGSKLPKPPVQEILPGTNSFAGEYTKATVGDNKIVFNALLPVKNGEGLLVVLNNFHKFLLGNNKSFETILKNTVPIEVSLERVINDMPVIKTVVTDFHGVASASFVNDLEQSGMFNDPYSGDWSTKFIVKTQTEH